MRRIVRLRDDVLSGRHILLQCKCDARPTALGTDLLFRVLRSDTPWVIAVNTERIALTFHRDAANALPLNTPLFTIPAGLVRILDRYLIAADIPKRDERRLTSTLTLCGSRSKRC